MTQRRAACVQGYESHNLRGDNDTPARHGIRDPMLTYAWYTGQLTARIKGRLDQAFVSLYDYNLLGRGLTQCTPEQVTMDKPAELDRDLVKYLAKRSRT